MRGGDFSLLEKSQRMHKVMRFHTLHPPKKIKDCKFITTPKVGKNSTRICSNNG
jgi:hypothetical protein